MDTRRIHGHVLYPRILWHEDPKKSKKRHSGIRGEDTTPDKAPRVPKISKSLEKNVGNGFFSLCVFNRFGAVLFKFMGF